MLKIYIINGKEWQYEEGEQPKGAVEKKPEDKSNKTPANKARRAPKDKGGRRGDMTRKTSDQSSH